MKEPVDHIIRPMLPWRTGGGVTECGHDAGKVPSITRDAYAARLREMGSQRSSMFTCMTCASTAQRWSTWEDDPRKALGREVEWEASWSRRDNGSQLRDELVAIAALIAAHRDEFDSIIAETRGRREWLKQKAAHAARPGPKPSSSTL